VNNLLEDFTLEIRQSFLFHPAKGVKVGLGAGDEVSGAIVDIAHDGEASLIEAVEAAEDEDTACVEGLLFQFACVRVTDRFGSCAIRVEDGFPADNAAGLRGSESGRSHSQTNGKKSTAGFHDMGENRVMLSVWAVITIPKF
jgi:hypothetical protein